MTQHQTLPSNKYGYDMVWSCIVCDGVSYKGPSGSRYAGGLGNGVQPEPPQKSGIPERLGLCTHLEPLEKNEELHMRDAGIAKNI